MGFSHLQTHVSAPPVYNKNHTKSSEKVNMGIYHKVYAMNWAKVEASNVHSNNNMLSGFSLKNACIFLKNLKYM